MFENEEKQVPFFRFEELRIYHKSVDYVTFLFDKTSKCPKELRTKFIDASDAIVQAIAEGSSHSKQHCANILKGAKPYVRACVIYTSIALKMGCFDSKIAEESNKYLMEITKMLGAFIASLTKTKSYNGSNNNESELYDIEIDIDDGSDSKLDLL